jgi:hypothetical protein
MHLKRCVRQDSQDRNNNASLSHENTIINFRGLTSSVRVQMVTFHKHRNGLLSYTLIFLDQLQKLSTFEGTLCSITGPKQRDALSSLIFNFALEYAIRRVQENQGGMKFNGTHPLLTYADGVNTVEENI